MNIQRLFESKKVVYSLEVFPPKKTTSIDTIYNTLYGLRGLKADFISVTYGAGGSEAQKNKNKGIYKNKNGDWVYYRDAWTWDKKRHVEMTYIIDL